MPDARLEQLLGEHRGAVEFFSSRAAAVPGERWLLPRAPGKWTPAQETRHIILSYSAIRGDLRGESRMALRGSALQRRIWRLLGLNWILLRRSIPRAVKAPREARPEWETGNRSQLLEELRGEVGTFEALFADAWTSRPRTALTHPYFGSLNLTQAITLVTVHTRHHAVLLPA